MWLFGVGVILLVWSLCLVINGLRHSNPSNAMIGLGLALLAGVCFR